MIMTTLLKNINVLFKTFNSKNIIHMNSRTLFSENFLGLTNYKRVRDVECAKPTAAVFKTKMNGLLGNPESTIIYKHIKSMCYLVESDNDFELFTKALQRYSSKTLYKDLRFTSFEIGTNIMKMYHVMNKPIEAFSTATEPKTTGLFKTVTCFTVLMDLLFESGMYDEVCKIFSVVQQRQINGLLFPFPCYILYQAALYKLNTNHSFNEAMDSFKKFLSYKKNPHLLIVIYTVIFASTRNISIFPLEYIQGDDPLSVNVKLAYLTRTGDLSKALEYFKSVENKSIIVKQIVKELCFRLTSAGESLKAEFEEFEKEIAVVNLKNQTLDELISKTFSTKDNIL